jgi:ABC-type phosphate transport system substrate-binding protein
MSRNPCDLNPDQQRSRPHRAWFPARQHHRSHAALIGTDDGPNKEQIEHAEGESTTKPLIIPVAQTAIAVVIDPPGTNAEYKLATGAVHGIGYVQVTRIFGGKEIKTSAQLKEAGVVEGTGCLGEITRVVRKEGSGTT